MNGQEQNKYFTLEDLPIEYVQKCVKLIIDSTSAEMKAEISAWQQDAPKESKFTHTLVTVGKLKQVIFKAGCLHKIVFGPLVGKK